MPQLPTQPNAPFGEEQTDEVIDLRPSELDATPPPARVSIARHDNPFSQMNQNERKRLLVQVLCQLVAYGEPDDAGPRRRAPSASAHG